MKILVANLGSTSFKYRLFDMADERQLARGGVERIGAAESLCFVEIGGRRTELTAHVPDHAVAVRQCLPQLTDPADRLPAGRRGGGGDRLQGGARRPRQRRAAGDADVLAAMEEMNDVAPAHNPPYIAAMRLLAEKLPEIPLVAAFETGFHATVPDRLRYYPAPIEWADQLHVKRWGFHGASHRYIADAHRRAAAARRPAGHLLPPGRFEQPVCDPRTAERGDVDGHESRSRACRTTTASATSIPFALPVIMQRHRQVARSRCSTTLANQSGLLGLSGVSGDVRDLEEAAAQGHARAQLALDVFVTEIRRHLGGLLVELGGLDALVFTGGIGENGAAIRAGVCAGPGGAWASCSIRGQCRRRRGECRISSADSRRADLDRADQRGTDRRPADAAIVGRISGMFVAKVTGSLVSTQKVDSMVGYKLLVVEPYRLDAERSQVAGDDRPHVCGRRHAGRRRRRLRADHPRLQRPADSRNQEHADRHAGHRPRRPGARGEHGGLPTRSDDD